MEFTAHFLIGEKNDITNRFALIIDSEKTK